MYWEIENDMLSVICGNLKIGKLGETVIEN
jgi:hypothetical protein